jgi:hypothetical protein
MLDGVPSKRRPNLCRDRLEFLAGWPVRVVRTKPKAEAIASMPRDHMQVDVEDLLASRLAIREEQVDTLALQLARAQSSSDPLPDDHEMAGSNR